VAAGLRVWSPLWFGRAAFDVAAAFENTPGFLGSSKAVSHEKTKTNSVGGLNRLASKDQLSFCRRLAEQ